MTRLLALVLLLPGLALGASVNLAWDAPSEMPPASCTGQAYTIAWGTATGAYTAGKLTVPVTQTTATVPGLTVGAKLFFAANLATANCGTSAWSNEVAYTVPIVGPGNLRIPPTAAAMSPRTGTFKLGLSVVRNLSMTNTSLKPITIENVTFSGEAASMLALGAFPLPTTVALGQSVSVPYRLTPTAKGYLTAEARIETDQGYIPTPLALLVQ